MADELALDPGTLVVAHGTAADAVLRFVEKYEVSRFTAVAGLFYSQRGNESQFLARIRCIEVETGTRRLS